MKRVLDGRALLDAFKKEHGIKSDDLARSLMTIETFAPQPKEAARETSTAPIRRGTIRDAR